MSTQIEQFKDLLRENLEKLAEESSELNPEDKYKEVHRIAFDLALENFPELKAAYGDFAKTFRAGIKGKGLKTEKQKLGHLVSISNAAICRVFKRKLVEVKGPDPKKEDKVKESGFIIPNGEIKDSPTDLLRAWVEAGNLYLPPLQVISYFSQKSYNSFHTAMARLKEKGWEFERQKDSSYKVTRKPEEKITMTRAELEELITKEASKVVESILKKSL